MKNKIKVVVSKFSPLIINTNGTFTGFEIDLWEAVAKEIGHDFLYEEHAFQDIIPMLAERKVDVGLAGITITEKREKIIDFSYPTLDSGLSMLVNKDRKSIRIFESIKSFFREGYKTIVSPLLLVVAFIVIFGNLLYFVEVSSKTFDAHYFPGIFESFWLVICSMSTDSFGDYVPHTWLGRVVTTGIIVGGVAIFGLLLAQVTAFIAIKKIKGDINTYRDLAGKAVGTLKGSTSVGMLQKIGAKVVPVSVIEEAYEMLKKKEIDAVVFDAPILSYYAKNEGSEYFEIVGELFERQQYGIALQDKSPLREEINQVILRLRESGYYESVYKKWFGDDDMMEA